MNPENGRSRWLLRLRNVPSLNFYGTVGSERRVLERLWDRTRPDVILGHFGGAALRLLPLARAHNIPIVAYFHGHDISSMLRNRWYRGSLLRNLHRFSKAITVGTHQAQWLLEQGMPRDRVHVIPSGTRTDVFLPAFTPPPEPLTIISVSRLVEQKGVEYTIRAFTAAAARRPGIRLWIIGDGPERDRLGALAKNLNPKDGEICFLGTKRSEEVALLMQQSHIFVQHSLNTKGGWIEGFGNTITEAMSCQLPIVATDCPGIRDQVTHGVSGLLVPQRNDEAMADALINLLNDPALRNELGFRGREIAVARFDARRSLIQLEDVLLDAARGMRDETASE